MAVSRSGEQGRADPAAGRFLSTLAIGAAVAGLAVAYPHGILGIALLPAWGLLLAWLATSSAVSWRGEHPAASPEPAELAGTGPGSR